MSRCARRYTAKSMLGSLGVMLGLSGVAHATTIPVGEFSKEFEAKVTLEDSSDVFRKGSVAVYDRKSGKRLIMIKSDELYVELEQGVAPANVVELPYGRQSVVIYDDFNFDGMKDLAVMDGQESCYHGPSFTIFLRTARGFVESQAFTALAHEYCGMFSVDPTKRQLATMTKSGCCWHQFNTYVVAGNKPKVIESIETSVAEFSETYTKVSTTGRRTTNEYFLSTEGSSAVEVLSFTLASNPAKRVLLLSAENTLDYALVVGQDKRVEFSYELDVNNHRAGKKARDEPVPFTWYRKDGALTVANGPFVYTVYDQPGKLGVQVITPQKKTFIAGDPATKRGSLDVLGKATLENLVVK